MSEFHHAKSRLNETFFAGENGHSYIFLYVKITWFCFFFPMGRKGVGGFGSDTVYIYN